MDRLRCCEAAQPTNADGITPSWPSDARPGPDRSEFCLPPVGDDDLIPPTMPWERPMQQTGEALEQLKLLAEDIRRQAQRMEQEQTQHFQRVERLFIQGRGPGAPQDDGALFAAREDTPRRGVHGSAGAEAPVGPPAPRSLGNEAREPLASPKGDSAGGPGPSTASQQTSALPPVATDGVAAQVELEFVPSGSGRCSKLLAVLINRLNGHSEEEEQKRDEGALADKESVREPDWVGWVKSSKFDLLGGFFIVVNALVICLELEYRGGVQAHQRLREYPEHPNDDYFENVMVEWAAAEMVVNILDHIFCAIFTMELLLRLAAYRKELFLHAANWLDITIVIVAMLELYVLPLMQAAIPNVTFLRLLRLMRLAKVLRVVRAMSLFQPLRLLLISIVNSLSSLAWSICLLSMIQMIVSIFMTQLLFSYIMDSDNPKPLRDDLYTYFGRFSHSMLTMYELTMAPGAWAKVGRMLIFEVHWLYALVFWSYGWLVSFTIVRVISALFLKQVLAAAAVDPEGAMRDNERKRKHDVRRLRMLFEQADTDGGGQMAMEEFKQLLGQPRAKTMLSLLEIDAHDVEGLFHLLDDGDGHIHLDEFVDGVMRVRGHAKAMDMLTLLYGTQRVQSKCEVLRELVEEKLARLEAALAQLLRRDSRLGSASSR